MFCHLDSTVGSYCHRGVLCCSFVHGHPLFLCVFRLCFFLPQLYETFTSFIQSDYPSCLSVGTTSLLHFFLHSCQKLCALLVQKERRRLVIIGCIVQEIVTSHMSRSESIILNVMPIRKVKVK